MDREEELVKSDVRIAALSIHHSLTDTGEDPEHSRAQDGRIREEKPERK